MYYLKYIIVLFFLTGCYSFTPILQVKDGDCVDRAIQHKQELRKKGYETRLIVGLTNGDGHAWIEYKDKKTGEWKRINNLKGRVNDEKN